MRRCKEKERRTGKRKIEREKDREELNRKIEGQRVEKERWRWIGSPR